MKPMRLSSPVWRLCLISTVLAFPRQRARTCPGGCPGRYPQPYDVNHPAYVISRWVPHPRTAPSGTGTKRTNQGGDMIEQHEIETVAGATAYDSNGDKIGKVGQLFLDDRTGQPEFVTVNTGLFGTSESFVPVQQAT